MLIGLLSRRGWLGGLGVAALLTGLLALAGAAEAAFPGRNGLLAVQPLKGSGVVLVKPNGAEERRVCQPGSACNGSAVGSGCYVAQGLCPYLPLRPAWSPDGRVLAVFGKSPAYVAGQVDHVAPPYVAASSVIYPDGSCVICGYNAFLPTGPGDTAFTSNPTLLTTVESLRSPSGSYPPEGLVEAGVDGLPRKVLLSGALSDPAWSSRGELAVVRGGWIWVGHPGKLRRLAPGNSASWSPGGMRIAFALKGWLMVGSVRGGSFRRLVPGTAPAWSPDGKWIAFFGKRHGLSVVPAAGGRVRHVGGVTGRRVDWQPLPTTAPAPCLTPPGYSVLASSDTAIVSVDNITPSKASPVATVAAMGCLHADGRERLLSQYEGTTSSIRGAQVAGTYAALVTNFVVLLGHVLSQSSEVTLFDLRTGCQLNGACAPSVPRRVGESVGCSPGDCEIDQLVLGSDAVSAAHTTNRDGFVNGRYCTCTVEQIQASDSTGVHTLDSITEPDGSPTALTKLTLTGDTLTWNNNGGPRSAQLQP